MCNALNLLLSNITNTLYKAFAHFDFDIWLLTITLSKGIAISIGSTASIPYAKEYGVAYVELRIDVLYLHRENGSLSGQSL